MQPTASLAANAPKLQWWLAFALSALILCLAAFLNGGPIIDPDSTRYLQDGHDLVRRHWPPGMRPVFYGILIYPLYLERSAWPVILLQGLVLGHLLHLGLRATGARLSPSQFLAVAAGFALLTTLSWNVAHVLPDLFTGVLILALFLLVFRGNGLSRWETAYVFLLTTACICFHLSNIAISTTAAVASSALWLVWRRSRPVLRPHFLIGAILLAFAAYFTFSTVAWHRLSFTMYRAPHLLGRMLADGPARDYLKIVCNNGREHYQICPFVDGLPATENDILWDYFYKIPVTDGIKFRAEENEIVKGTIAMFPLQVARHMVVNTGRQLIDIEPEVNDDTPFLDKLRAAFPAIAATAERTRQFQGGFRSWTMRGIIATHDTLLVLSALACAVMARRAYARRLYRPLYLMAVVLFGLVVNAFVTGALAGVFGRYENRAIWLVPLCALAAGLALARSRRPAPARDLPLHRSGPIGAPPGR